MADKISDVIYKIVSKAVHTKSYSNPEMDKAVADIKQLLHRKVEESTIHFLAKKEVYKVIDKL